MKIFDLHCDTFTELYDRETSLFDESLSVNKSELCGFDTAVQTFAVFLRPDEQDSVGRYSKVLACGKRRLCDAGIEICTKQRQLKAKGVKAMLSVEGGVPSFSPDFIETMRLDGVRTVSVTWNSDNVLAGGALGTGGLTNLGRNVISELNRCNMVTDLSHLNRRSFFEAVETADTVAATHSGIDALVKHPRNLTDAQLKAVKEKRGIIGLCVYPDFIGDDVFEGFYRAVIHCLELGLENNIAIGTDFDGAKMSRKLSKVSQLSGLYEFLIQRKIGKEQCDKIFYENSAEFYSNVMTK